MNSAVPQVWRERRDGRWASFELLPVPGVSCRMVARGGEGELGIPGLVMLRQVHSNVVHCVDAATPATGELVGDALFTDAPGLSLGIHVADCLPVYFFSDSAPVVGIAHAGWRGTHLRIVERVVGAIQDRLGIEPARLSYAFGACIEPNCYPVGPEVATQYSGFPKPGEFLTSVGEKSDRVLLDLKTANRQLLQELGLSEAASLDLCPRCRSDLFHSARREKSPGRNLALIWRS